jgi:hypothetical protein
MIKNETLIKYFKMNLKSFTILVYLKVLRLYSLNSLQIKYFNKNWFISVGSSLFSLTLNSLIGEKLTKNILKRYEKNKKIDNSTREVISIGLSIFYVLFFKFIYMFIFFKKNIVNSKYIQVTIISILSITFYTLVIKPFFTNTYISRFLNSIISDTILLLSSDFIEDAKIDSSMFDIELSTLGTFFRIILNSVIKL